MNPHIGSSGSAFAAPSARRTGRASWHWKAGRPVVIWFALLVLLALAQQWVPQSRWLLVHIAALGMVTNSILIWSQHFTEALLKNRQTDQSRNLQAWRLSILNAGIVVTIAGVLSGLWLLTLAGSVLIGGTVAWHAVNLMYQLRRALPARFSITVKFYIAAALLLPIGAAFGAVLAYGPDSYSRFLLAHQSVNLLGFVGLTVMGTLITLWPTMLRTRMVEGMADAGRYGLGAMLAGTVVTTAAASFGWRFPAAAGVLLYLTGFCFLGWFLLRCAVQRRPDDYATFSAGAGLLWLAGSLATLLVLLLTGPVDAGRLHSLTIPLLAGFALQVLLGAMSFLIPTVMGGGPSAVRNARTEMTRFAMLRISVINGALLVWILPVPALVQSIMAVLVLAGFASFLPLMLRSVKASIAGRKAMQPAPGKRLPAHRKEPDGSSAGRHLKWTAAGLAVVLAGVGTGFGLASGTGGEAAVEPTGQTTTVQVSMRDMRYVPATVDVPAGDRLVVELTNDDASVVHDLALETGAASGRLYPGESETVDLGVITADMDGWCTVGGHRAMGMVFKVKIKAT